jgi:uncharacterized protein (TIGR03437 family)
MKQLLCNGLITRGLHLSPLGRHFVLLIAGITIAAQASYAQSIFGSNLIVNGGAETGTAATDPTKTVPIPGWTSGTGNVVVLPYGVSGFLLGSSPAPPDHMFNYFSAGSGYDSSTLTQNINVSSAATLIGVGNVKYTASGFLGIASEGYGTPSAKMQLDFKNAGGQLFSSVVVEPPSFTNRVGLTAQQQIGLVPAGTATITVTLTFTVFCAVGNSVNCSYGAADSLSFVLSALGTNPASVLGANLLVNGNAEAGPNAPNGSLAPYIPGWSTTYGASVAPYGGSGFISATDPGPADRGTNLFTGVYAGEATQTISMYQDIDVSAAASLIDSGQIDYQVSAWLGAVGIGAPTLTYTFFDWSGTQRAPTGQLTVTHSGISLLSASNSAALPAGTRRVHIAITFAGSDFLADDISFSIGNLGAPALTNVLNGATAQSTIAASTYVAIYGTNLSTTNPGRQWAGPDFTTNANGTISLPTSLDGTSVTVNGTPAYVEYISPTQLNIITPAIAATGNGIQVVVSLNGTVSFAFPITLENLAPSFFAWDPGTADNGKYLIAQHAATGANVGKVGLFPTAPANFTTPAVPGETIVLYGTGFGPTSPPIVPGMVTDQTYDLSPTPTATLGSIPATVGFAGLIAGFAEVYQFNVVIPTNALNGDLPFVVKVNGTESFSGDITVQAP